MSTVHKPTNSLAHPLEDNPFRYGWREVRKRDARGRINYVRQPLTLEDVLHPQIGDVMPGNSAHALDCAYLLVVLLSHLADNLQAVVLNDVLIYWDDPQLRHHGPDIAVIFGVRRRQARYPSFQVAQEGVRPELIIEITSPDTRQLDLRTKRRQYWRARVPFYVVIDERIVRGQRRLRLLGYRQGLRGYQRLPSNAQGRLWLDAVHLFLGQEDGRVALYNAQGQRLGDYQEVEQARHVAEERVQEVEQARKAAEQRVLELEAELRRLRGEG